MLYSTYVHICMQQQLMKKGMNLEGSEVCRGRFGGRKGEMIYYDLKKVKETYLFRVTKKDAHQVPQSRSRTVVQCSPVCTQHVHTCVCAHLLLGHRSGSLEQGRKVYSSFYRCQDLRGLIIFV